MHTDLQFHLLLSGSTVHETVHDEWHNHQAYHILAVECMGKYGLCCEALLCNKALVVLTLSLIKPRIKFQVFSCIMRCPV